MPLAKKRSTLAKKLELDLTKVKRKSIPHEFVLDALTSLSPWTRPMFGFLAVYVGKKIVLILRDKPTYRRDNGVWIATTHEHHDSLRDEFPSVRSIGLLGKKITGWQILPAEAPDFEASALHACELIAAGDPRIGKIPSERRKTETGTVKTARSAKRRA